MHTEGVETGEFSLEDRKFLLTLARRNLAERAAGREVVLHDTHVPPKLKERRGCFVTLFKSGELRGCIGHVLAQMPLFEAVSYNACAAGFRDPRFEPISPRELEELEIEISVLSDLQPINAPSPDQLLAQLRPHVDGVLLQRGGRMSTFLPQVWETVPGKEDFLSRLSLKAGWEPEAWKGKDVSISTYQVVSFSDPDSGSEG